MEQYTKSNGHCVSYRHAKHVCDPVLHPNYERLFIAHWLLYFVADADAERKWLSRCYGLFNSESFMQR